MANESSTRPSRWGPSVARTKQQSGSRRSKKYRAQGTVDCAENVNNGIRDGTPPRMALRLTALR